MRVIKNEEGLEYSWQDKFPASTRCSCGGQGKIAFVAIEDGEENDGYVCDFRPEDTDLWPHDAIAVAVYICKKCMNTISKMNQA